MAKKAKTSELTIEEKLEQAMVVPGYEPYKIPDNWCWTFVGVLSNLYRGVSYKKNDGHTAKQLDDCLVLRGGNINEGVIELDSDNIYVNSSIVSDVQLLKKYDIVIVTSTGSKKVIGRAGVSYSDYSNVAFGAFLTLVRPIEKIYKPFLAYYFQHDDYRNRIRNLANGVNINNVKNEYITQTPVPFPPLLEQQRIVERIELLFSKLDEAKEKAQEFIDSYEARKAAILHKAFSGELTAKWRSENGIEIDSWKRELISECCKLGSGGTPSRKNNSYYTGSIPWIKTGEIDWNIVDYSEENITQEAIDNSSAKLYKPGAVLVAMYGMGITRGKAAILGIEAATNQAVCVLQPKEYLLNRFLFYFFMCNYWNIRECAVGGNQLNLSATIIGKLSLMIPSLEEQVEITRLLDYAIEKENETKQTAETVINQIDTMKKSILCRAFRGELGTNDPKEESAIELLKEILSEDDKADEQSKPKSKRVVIPKELDSKLESELERKIIKLFMKSDNSEVTVDEIIKISPKKDFDIIEAIRALEEKQIIKKTECEKYMFDNSLL